MTNSLTNLLLLSIKLEQEKKRIANLELQIKKSRASIQEILSKYQTPTR